MDKKILGLDIGMSYIGYSVLRGSSILDMGVLGYEAPIDRKTKESLQARRALQKRARRTLRRRSIRKKLILKLLLEEIIPDKDTLHGVLSPKGNASEMNPYALRSAGLTRRLESMEWAKVLFHLAKRRGYEPRGKQEADDKETGVIKEKLKELEDNWDKENYPSIGDYLYRMIITSGKNVPVRNKGEGNYQFTVKRSWLRDELELLFKKQRSLSNPFASESLEKKYFEIFNYVHPMQSYEDKVGECSFLKGEKRGAIKAICYEYYTFLQKLNNLRVFRKDDDPRKEKESLRGLDERERKVVIEKFRTTSKMSYKTLRTALKLDKAWGFNMTNSSKGNEIKEEGKEYFYTKSNSTLDSFYALKDHLSKDCFEALEKNYWEGFDALVQEISYEDDLSKAEDRVNKKLDELENLTVFKKEIITTLFNEEKFAQINRLKGFGRLSQKVIRCLLPLMEGGQGYSEAMKSLGFDHTKIEELNVENITNPVVRYAVLKIESLIRGIKRRHKDIDAIHVELARDLKMTKKQKALHIKKDNANKKENEGLKKEIEERGGVFNRDNRIKHKLMRSQGCRCIYSGEAITTSNFHDCEVDHILPYSRTFDDGFNNKVLVLKSANQKKGNNIPSEFFSKEQMEQIQTRARSLLNSKKISQRKYENLTMTPEEFAEKELKFKERNLNDTKYISRVIKNSVEKWYFGENTDGLEGSKRRVKTFPGPLTNKLRKDWCINSFKKYEKEDGTTERYQDERNHSLDALVLALATEGNLNRISRFRGSLEVEDSRLANAVTKIPNPIGFKNFGQKLIDWGYEKPDPNGTSKPMKPFVVRSVKIKTDGEVHEETIRSFPIPLPREKSRLKKFLGESYEDIHFELQEKNLIMNVDSDFFRLRLGRLRKDKTKYQNVNAVLEDYEELVEPIFKQYFDETIPKEKKILDDLKEFLTAPGKSAIAFLDRVPLSEVTKKDEGKAKKGLEHLFEKDTRNKALYEHLKKELGAEDSFKKIVKEREIFFNGTKIRKITLASSEVQSGMPVRGGFANRGDQIRVDIFRKKEPNKNGWFEHVMVVVYAMDSRLKTPPMAYVVPGEGITGKKVDETYEFVTTLNVNDYVKVHYANGTVKEGYYRTSDSINASLSLLHHSDSIGAKKEISTSIKTQVKVVEKYRLGYFGERAKIIGEKRMWLGKPCT